jgi:hypothetical protein
MEQDDYHAYQAAKSPKNITISGVQVVKDGSSAITRPGKLYHIGNDRLKW